ncbi:unnamed protein product [Cuscuta europaea]|uniref:H15 domain-containing protein n=1 Tax=Cuscuta europaea TaxID=41803 RepID=A0A9P1EKV5_CUSEU|nr:unnamed protein product [Cuscuta europaea]
MDCLNPPHLPVEPPPGIPPVTGDSGSQYRNDDSKSAMQNFRSLMMKAVIASLGNNTLTLAQSSVVEEALCQCFPLLRAPDHPPYAWMIRTAIEKLKEEGGSSECAISKCIMSDNPELPWAHSTLLKCHLTKLCEKGDIVRTQDGLYLLNYQNNLIPHIPNSTLNSTICSLSLDPSSNSPDSDSTTSVSPMRKRRKRKRKLKKVGIKKRLGRPPKKKNILLKQKRKVRGRPPKKEKWNKKVSSLEQESFNAIEATHNQMDWQNVEVPPVPTNVGLEVQNLVVKARSDIIGIRNEGEEQKMIKGLKPSRLKNTCSQPEAEGQLGHLKGKSEMISEADRKENVCMKPKRKPRGRPPKKVNWNEKVSSLEEETFNATETTNIQMEWQNVEVPVVHMGAGSEDQNPVVEGRSDVIEAENERQENEMMKGLNPSSLENTDSQPEADGQFGQLKEKSGMNSETTTKENIRMKPKRKARGRPPKKVNVNEQVSSLEEETFNATETTNIQMEWQNVEVPVVPTGVGSEEQNPVVDGRSDIIEAENEREKENEMMKGLNPTRLENTDCQPEADGQFGQLQGKSEINSQTATKENIGTKPRRKTRGRPRKKVNWNENVSSLEEETFNATERTNIQMEWQNVEVSVVPTGVRSEEQNPVVEGRSDIIEAENEREEENEMMKGPSPTRLENTDCQLGEGQIGQSKGKSEMSSEAAMKKNISLIPKRKVRGRPPKILKMKEKVSSSDEVAINAIEATDKQMEWQKVEVQAVPMDVVTQEQNAVVRATSDVIETENEQEEEEEEVMKEQNLSVLEIKDSPLEADLNAEAANKMGLQEHNLSELVVPMEEECNQEEILMEENIAEVEAMNGNQAEKESKEDNNPGTIKADKMDQGCSTHLIVQNLGDQAAKQNLANETNTSAKESGVKIEKQMKNRVFRKCSQNGGIEMVASPKTDDFGAGRCLRSRGKIQPAQRLETLQKTTIFCSEIPKHEGNTLVPNRPEETGTKANCEHEQEIVACGDHHSHVEEQMVECDNEIMSFQFQQNKIAAPMVETQQAQFQQPNHRQLRSRTPKIEPGTEVQRVLQRVCSLPAIKKVDRKIEPGSEEKNVVQSASSAPATRIVTRKMAAATASYISPYFSLDEKKQEQQKTKNFSKNQVDEGVSSMPRRSARLAMEQ